MKLSPRTQAALSAALLLALLASLRLQKDLNEKIDALEMRNQPPPAKNLLNLPQTQTP